MSIVPIVSIVVKGFVGSQGILSSPITHVRYLNTNSWEYRFSSLCFKPLERTVDTLVELGTNFYCTDQYNYRLDRLLPRPTPYCMVHLKARRGEAVFIDLSNNPLWLPIEDVRASVEVSLFQAGSATSVNEPMEVTAHLCCRPRE